MKINAKFTLTLTLETEFILGISRVSNEAHYRSEIYFNEHDGQSMGGILEKILEMYPKADAIVEHVGNEVWISGFDLAPIAGEYLVDFTQVFLKIDDETETEWDRDIISVNKISS